MLIRFFEMLGILVAVAAFVLGSVWIARRIGKGGGNANADCGDCGTAHRDDMHKSSPAPDNRRRGNRS